MDIDPASLVILTYPDPILRQKTKKIREITSSIRAVARKMIELMHEADGVGLAAPQVGLSWRMFVTLASQDEPAGTREGRVFINPEITIENRELAIHEEGCLSLPDIRGDIRRPLAVTVKALDPDGKQFSMTDNDLLARVWQHELDHLNGVLIIDRMNPMDRIAVRKALKELEATTIEG